MKIKKNLLKSKWKEKLWYILGLDEGGVHGGYCSMRGSNHVSLIECSYKLLKLVGMGVFPHSVKDSLQKGDIGGSWHCNEARLVFIHVLDSCPWCSWFFCVFLILVLDSSGFFFLNPECQGNTKYWKAIDIEPKCKASFPGCVGACIFGRDKWTFHKFGLGGLKNLGKRLGSVQTLDSPKRPV